MTHQRNKMSNNPAALIIGFIVLFVFGYLLFTMVKGVYKLLSFIFPALLIATLILDRKVLFNYFNWIVRTFKKDSGKGALYAVLSIVGFPFVTAFLFFKALMNWQVKKANGGHTPGQFSEFEELDTQELPHDVELPQLDDKEENNDYEDLVK